MSQSGNDDQIKKSAIPALIVHIFSWMIAIPAFIILHKLLPDLAWPLQIDRILLFLATLGITEIIFQWIRPFVLIGFSAMVLFLLYGTISGGYGFGTLYKDYRAMLIAMMDSPKPQNIIISKLRPFPDKFEILNAIDFDHADVRNFAVEATNKHFSEEQGYKDERVIVQCFAVFKEINANWNYVNDPKSREYFAKASESVRHLSGDCDDHSILMAAAIKSIGGTIRLVRTSGHIYPEILIGDRKNLESLNYLIRRKLFKEESRGKDLHYHIDEDERIWLNLDYTATYPGGPFLSEEIIAILEI